MNNFILTSTDIIAILVIGPLLTGILFGFGYWVFELTLDALDEIYALYEGLVARKK
jgi:hypothetical protein